jgi:hypothetical protein
MQPHTWNTNRNDTTCHVFAKWHNYLNSDVWTPINAQLIESGGVFSLSQAPYSVTLPKLANDWYEFSSTNTYDIWHKIVRPDAPKSISKRFPTAEPVSGLLTAEGILFTGAFPGLNADRLVQPHEQKLRDLVVFRSMPPGQGQVEVPFEIDFGTLPILKSIGRGKEAVEHDFKKDGDFEKGLSFTTSRFRGVKIQDPKVWDSNGRRQGIKVSGKVVGSRFVGKKIIPRSFFDDATFPVYTDTVATFYPDPDPETTSIDGWIDKQIGSGGTWSSVRNAGSGSVVNMSDGSNRAGIQSSSVPEWTDILRAYLLFDTSSLPNTSLITSASMNCYASLKNADYGGAVTVVSSSPASNIDLVNADYSQIGSTAFCTPLDVGSIITGNYNAIALNASGIAAITPIGISKFGLRWEDDRANTEPTLLAGGIKYSYVDTISAESSGTGSDPYLSVNYVEDLRRGYYGGQRLRVSAGRINFKV